MLCESGSYRSAENGTRQSDCTACPAGSACVSGSETPKACAPGTVTTASGSAACSKCAVGSYQPLEGETSCRHCKEGYYCLEGAAYSLPCPAGRHANQTELNLTGFLSSQDSCVICPAGTACSIGSTQPQPCLPGSFSVKSEAERCDLCVSGEFQDQHGATACKQCTSGSYCERGTPNPTPCPGGTSSNNLGATDRTACIPVLAGFWAPLGSSEPEPCPTTGFYCPGAAADELYGGSKPVLVPVGESTTTEEVETVQKEMTLGLSCASFDMNKVKQSLAAQYNVDVSLISLSNPCARRRRQLQRAKRALAALTITITIATGSTTPDGTAISAPPIAELLTAVQAVDDAALTSSLGQALGVPITVSSTIPVQATVSRIVPSFCPRGFWCTAGLTVACETGFYNPTTNANNQSACIKCPEHAVTLGSNATSLADCVCEERYYNKEQLSGGVRCLLCPIGSSCTTAGMTLERMPLKTGFYRRSRTSDDVRACADVAVNCPNGQGECAQSHSGCIGGDDPARPCRPGLTGVFCLACTNVSRPHYYVAASEAAPAYCRPCDDIAMTLLIGCICLVALPLIAFAVIRSWRCLPLSWRTALWRRWTAYGVRSKLKSIVSFYQIACKVSVVYQITLPASVTALLGLFEVAIYLGLDITAPFECLGAGSYLRRLQFWIVAPLVLIVVLFGVGVAVRRGNWRAGATWALPLVIRLMFVLYSTINLRAFEAFRCYDFGVDGRWLMADVEVACESPAHSWIKINAWVAIAIYPIGWTATTALLLFAARKSIAGKEPPTALSHALSFVTDEFEADMFWWEVLEMLRRFLLVGMMSIVLEGTLVQICIAALFCILYLVLQLQANPYKDPSDDYVALASTASLAVLFFSCVVLKVGVLTDTPEVNSILTDRLRERFEVPAAMLSVVIFGSVVCALVISFFVTMHLMRRDRQQRLLEERAAKARRLLYVASKQQVIPPVLGGDLCYHIFLSHVWSTAQVRSWVEHYRPKSLSFPCGIDPGTGTDERPSRLPPNRRTRCGSCARGCSR